MKKNTLLFSCIILLSACGNSVELEDDSSTTDSQNTTITTEVNTENEPEKAEEVAAFKTIEDYIKITSKTQLYETFDASNIKDEENWYAEGTVKLESSTLTNPADSTVIKYIWEKNEGEAVGTIEFEYNLFDEDYNILGTQKIYSENGLFTGMTLKELEEWNGAPFEFMGFGWDFEGGMMEEEGKIGDSKIIIRMSYDLENEGSGYKNIIGDILLKSDEDNVKDEPIFIGTLTYYSNL